MATNKGVAKTMQPPNRGGGTIECKADKRVFWGFHGTK